MSWTASITDFKRITDHISVSVVFADGTTIPFSRVFSTSDFESLKSELRQQIAALTAQDSFLQALTKGPVDLTTAPPTPPTQADIDRKNYFNLLEKYKQVQQDIANGLIKADDPAVTQLTSNLKAAYKPEYSGL